MGYSRPWKSFHEHLELRRSRGMVVTDEAAALDYLQCVRYYHQGDYWYPFHKRYQKMEQRYGIREMPQMRIGKT